MRLLFVSPMATSAALLFSLPLAAQLPDDLKRRFDEAERRIVRLPPTSFPNLPTSLVRDIQHRGCTIPQEATSKQPNNVIRGEFARPGQADWAVLCSTKGVSSILVFWNGNPDKPAVIAPMEDRGYLQTISATEIGYSRAIAPVSGSVIRRHHQAYGGPTPPPIDHMGVDDAFVGKASVTWYFYRGEWLKLTGAD